MTDSRQIVRRPQSPAPRPFGSLPDAQTGLTVERALELSGVEPTELALLASTTFKEARSLEELVTLVATTRRRGLDGLSKQVYFERFGGDNNDPSLHTGIDGLRGIAAATGRYGGSSEPRYSGTYDMALDDRGNTKSVPEKCSQTVWAIVQGRSCAFEGVAFMEESYPGPGGRGRMWRQRPRGMLAIAAERQALRRAFPNETSGVGDYDEGQEPESPKPPLPAPTRTVGESAAEYDRIFASSETEVAPPPTPKTKRERPLQDLIDRYGERLEQAIEDGLIPEEYRSQWTLPPNAARDVVMDCVTRLKDLFSAQESSIPERSEPAAEFTTPPPPAPLMVTVRSALGQKLATLNEDAARLEVEYSDCKAIFPAPEEDVIRSIERLEDRLQTKKDQLAGVNEPVAAQGTFG